jgi:hypothetical protein
MRYTQTVGNLEIERWSAVALYDPKTGNVVHLHQCVSLKGGQHPTKVRLERDARDGLKQVAAGRAVPRRLLALHLDPRTLDTEHHYGVDPRRRALVRMPRRRVTRRTVARDTKD